MTLPAASMTNDKGLPGTLLHLSLMRAARSHSSFVIRHHFRGSLLAS
jgi:hypothetical protein